MSKALVKHLEVSDSARRERVPGRKLLRRCLASAQEKPNEVTQCIKNILDHNPAAFAKHNKRGAS